MRAWRRAGPAACDGSLAITRRGAACGLAATHARKTAHQRRQRCLGGIGHIDLRRKAPPAAAAIPSLHIRVFNGISLALDQSRTA
jgi:hypothetical protein